MLFQSHSRIIGNHLGDRITQGIRHIQYAPYVPDDTFRCQRTKGNDLDYRSFPYFRTT